MSRYIDADALIEAMGEEPYVWTDSAEEIAERNQWLTDMGIIENAPTIDAVEVVRGEWKPFDLTWGRSLYACSVCEEVEYLPCDAFNGKPFFKYCPNCGARMKGADDE